MRDGERRDGERRDGGRDGGRRDGEERRGGDKGELICGREGFCDEAQCRDKVRLG